MFQDTDNVKFGNPQSVSTIEVKMIPGDKRRFGSLLRDTKSPDEHGNIIGLSGCNPQVREVKLLNDSGELDSTWFLVAPELPHAESKCILLQRDGITWRYLVYTQGEGLTSESKWQPIMQYESTASDGGGSSALENF